MLGQAVLTLVSILQLCDLGPVPVLKLAVVADDACDVLHGYCRSLAEKECFPRLPRMIADFRNRHLRVASVDVAADVDAVHVVGVGLRPKPAESVVIYDSLIEVPRVQCDPRFCSSGGSLRQDVGAVKVLRKYTATVRACQARALLDFGHVYQHTWCVEEAPWK